MIIVDTAVWIDFLGRGDTAFASAVREGDILVHPYVVGEIRLGNLGERQRATLADLDELPVVLPARHSEVLRLIETARLGGSGIGYVDAHLLAAAKLTGNLVFTRDKRLRRAAEALGVAATSL